MNKIKSYHEFPLNEGQPRDEYYPSGYQLSRERSAFYREKVSPEDRETLNLMIGEAKKRGGGTASQEDLFTIFCAFDLMDKTPEEMTGIYSILRELAGLEEPNLQDINSINPLKYKAQKALLKHLSKLKDNPNYGTPGERDSRKMFLQRKFDF